MLTLPLRPCLQIIPCMAQGRATYGDEYRASGWLGVVTAGKLWIDFRATDNEDEVEKKTDALILEIAKTLNISMIYLLFTYMF